MPSPTFTLVQTYATPNFPLAHFDLYRLERPEEALELGLDDALDEGVQRTGDQHRCQRSEEREPSGRDLFESFDAHTCR